MSEITIHIGGNDKKQTKSKPKPKKTTDKSNDANDTTIIHKKPRGRAPKGMVWNNINGRWIDATGSSDISENKNKTTKTTKAIKIKEKETVKKDKVIVHKLETKNDEPKQAEETVKVDDVVMTTPQRDEAKIKKQQEQKGNPDNIRIISWNVNGINSILNKEVYQGKRFDDYLNNSDFDIICLSEIKLSTEEDIRKVDNKILQNYKYRYWNQSKVKRGYSGTVIFSKIQPINVMYGINKDNNDPEGRVIVIEFKGFYLINCYTPNSGVNSKSPLLRLDYRVNEWDIKFRNYMSELSNKKPIVIAGDLNISHKEIDLKNFKTNTRTAGFTIEERNSFDLLLNSGKGLIDSYRYFYPDKIKYSFWSSRFGGKARENNSGWRLDYFLVSTSFINNVVESEILSNIFGSDHCPLYLEIKI
jgi:exodeoxyribonuclease-3